MILLYYMTTNEHLTKAIVAQLRFQEMK